MARSLSIAALLTLLLVCGCVSVPLFDAFTKEAPSPVVPSSRINPPPPTTTPVRSYSYTPAPADVSIYVDSVGRKLLAANPQLGLRPQFQAYVFAKPEAFHQGTRVIKVSDGLVKQCKNEGQLAAVLALQLAEIVSEREVLSNPSARTPPPMLPMDVPIGNAGMGASPDFTRLPELARFDKKRVENDRPATPPNPRPLASLYLLKAGYNRAELDGADALLRPGETTIAVQRPAPPINNGGWQPPVTRTDNGGWQPTR